MIDGVVNSYAGKQILVTGGAGYLSSNLIGLLKDVDCHIIRLARPGATFAPVRGTAHVRDVTGDIRDRVTWECVLEGVDIVFHFAAQTSAYVANENPSADLQVNVVPMLHLLESCRQSGWRPIVLFSSTVTVAGLPTRLPTNETHPDNPITVYDLHKLMAENYLKYYVNQGTVRGAVLRLANVYGPGPKNSRHDRGILNLMIRQALAGQPLTVYGKGDHLRDYVYVGDVVRAFLHAGSKIERVNGQHVVIGSGEGHTIVEAANLVADRVAVKRGERVPVMHIEPPPGQLAIETRNFVADSRRFTQATGWRAHYSLSEGIEETIQAFV